MVDFSEISKLQNRPPGNLHALVHELQVTNIILWDFKFSKCVLGYDYVYLHSGNIQQTTRRHI